MVNSFITENDQYNECFLLHSTVPCEPDLQKKIQILNGNDETSFQANTAIAHCICRRVNGLQDYCRRAKPTIGSAPPYWHPESNNFIYNLVTKSNFFEKPALDNLRISLEIMRGHALFKNITKISTPKIGYGLDKLQWTDVFKLLQDTFTYSGIQIQIITKQETDYIRRNSSSNNQHCVENEVENHTNEWTKERNELETDFTRDSKSCQPPCTEKLPTLRPKKLKDDLIEYYLQYQSDDIRNLIKQFAFRYTDLEDEELVTLIDMTIDFTDVYSQHKFDIGQTEQNIHVTLKPNSELRKQRPAKCPLHLKDILEKLLEQLQDPGIIREMGDDDELGSVFVNPIILPPEADYVKLVIDARYINSITNLTNYSWPLEPVQVIMTKINGKYLAASDLPCAYHQVLLSPETQKLTGLVIGGKQNTYHDGFNGLRGLPQWFSRMMAINFEPLIKKKKART